MKKHYLMSHKKVVAEFLNNSTPGNIALGIWQRAHPKRKDDSELIGYDLIAITHEVLAILRKELRKGQKAQKEIRNSLLGD